MLKCTVKNRGNRTVREISHHIIPYISQQTRKIWFFGVLLHKTTWNIYRIRERHDIPINHRLKLLCLSVCDFAKIIYIKWNEILFPLFFFYVFPLRHGSCCCLDAFLLLNSNKFHQVSWIRRRDLAILTSNTSVYTTDTRFNVIHIPTSNNWDLRIKPVEERDSGVFECQVNTDPKINFPIHLHVTSKLTTISRIYVLHIVLRFLSDMLFWVISPQNLQVQCSKHLSSPHHTEPEWWLYDVIPLNLHV